MKTILSILTVLCVVFSSFDWKKSEEINTLTAVEKADGWVLLFNGKTSDGWRKYKKTTLPDCWEITEDGTIFCLDKQRSEAKGKGRGDIVYGKKKFGNFHLKLEWKISSGGNSGVFYLGQENNSYGNIWMTTPELQILDSENHPNAKTGIPDYHKSGSLYDLIPAVPQNEKPFGEWNSAEIKVYNGSVLHIQNGETVVEYHLGTPEWEEIVAGSKFSKVNAKWADVAAEGYIGLQDHGNDVWFRNIKIKEL